MGVTEGDGPGMRSLSATTPSPPVCSILTPYCPGIPEALLTAPRPKDQGCLSWAVRLPQKTLKPRSGRGSCYLTCISPCRVHSGNTAQLFLRG